MKLTKDFSKIQSTFPDATFHRNSLGPGTLIHLDKDKKVTLWYQDKLYSFRGHVVNHVDDIIKSKFVRDSVTNASSKSKS